MSFNESRFLSLFSLSRFVTTKFEPENINVFLRKFVLGNLEESSRIFLGANVCYVYVQWKSFRACFPISSGERGSKLVRTWHVSKEDGIIHLKRVAKQLESKQWRIAQSATFPASSPMPDRNVFYWKSFFSLSRFVTKISVRGNNRICARKYKRIIRMQKFKRNPKEYLLVKTSVTCTCNKKAFVHILLLCWTGVIIFSNITCWKGRWDHWKNWRLSSKTTWVTKLSYLLRQATSSISTESSTKISSCTRSRTLTRKWFPRL